ncbi:hypothetical protein FKM82_003936 [Ascaphus truei]|uniref:GPI alpha-1,4-mannosyltransferase I, stabilizing subunit n=1 Tax=Ascaphus truei TaxID=8439 RepID=UPI003F5A8816
MPLRGLLTSICIFFCAAANSVAQSACPELIVRREILNTGFHRELVTRLDVQGFAEQVNSCSIVFKENVPSGLFLDPYQLSSLRKHNLTEVLLLESVDVEAPEYLSQEHAALVYAKPDPACTHCFISTVPVHARYHRPSAEIRETSFTLRNPQLLIHCSKDFPPSGCPQLSVVEAPCASEAGTACQWLDVPYIPVPKTLTAQVPVGITQHGPAVCFLTLVMTLICTGMIFSAVYKHGHLCA